jgi:hypothetical protein
MVSFKGSEQFHAYQPKTSTSTSKSPNELSVNSVVSKFEKFRALIKAALRPLPTETGDGTYTERPENVGLLRTILSLRWRDIPAIVSLMRNNLKSEPIDDKTYFMEHVVQVC